MNSIVASPEEAILRLKKGNEDFLSALKNNADVSLPLREFTAKNGQKPYAVVLTCSDSRVPPEHIFSAGIGELFVVRTAGMVVGEFELGSIEYGVKHLGAKVVLVMGHTKCGAAATAVCEITGKYKEQESGYISYVINEVRSAVAGTKDADEAEDLIIQNSYKKVLKSDLIKDLLSQKKIVVLKAKYDIETGKVNFFD